MLKKLVLHASRYSLAGLAGTFAGLISFPILTRMLSVSDYGLMSLIITTIYFVAAFAKGGLQFSIVRYYADALGGKGQWDLANFYSTIIFGMLGSGIIAMTLWILGINLSESFLGESKLKSMLLLTAILVLVEVCISMLSGFMQARQESGWWSIYRVCERYSILAATVLTLYFISKSLEGVMIARIITQITVISILGYFVLRKATFPPNKFSPPMLKEMVFYGFPLLGNELVSIILGLGDRYIIQWQVGSEPLGAYAAGYNLCEYVRMMIVMALFQAIRPMYFKLWADEGKEATQSFIQKSLYFYLMLSFPIIAGVSAIAPDLLILLTSGKYSEGAVVIPFIIAGLMIYGMHSMLGAGLLIHKSSTLFWLTLLSAIINMILNVIFIPYYGIGGAAVATLISYIILTSLEAYFGRKLLPIRFPFIAAVKFIFLSVIMYVVLLQIELPNPIAKMAVQVFSGGVIYCLLVLAADKKARSALFQRFK